MAVQTETAGRPEAAGQNWYARTPEEVAAAVAVDPAVGLPTARAGDLLAKNGPNALPEEKAKPGWLRFLDEYRSYMQIILVVAAVVSLVIKEWSTGVLLVLLTVLNAVVGMRQEGKAESAMNALRSMMKATARVRRDGSELVIPAEQVVVGDVVLITAGDEVPADGRIVAASALQIDESALTGESTPAAKSADTLPGGELGPGDQLNMSFMNTPVTHGSGTIIVTGTGTGTELGKISGMLAATAREESPLTRELNRLTLWIAAAAGITMIVMFALGRARGRPWDALFTAAVSLAIAAIPEALPTVRCFVKGAAPAVLARAASALSEGTSLAWDARLCERHQTHMERMEGAGQRVMAAATREVDPATFDPGGDLLGYVTDLQVTSLVGMVDPPRDESRDAVASAQAAHIRVRMVTGDDVITGAAIATQLGIDGEAMLGADFAALSESERLARIDSIGWWAGSPPSTRCSWPTRSRRRAKSSP
jgi:magnesium-transporting ATPase (P-type)